MAKKVWEVRESEEDDLRREIRDLKQENKHLKQLIKKLSKGKHRVDDLEEILKDYSEKEDAASKDKVIEEEKPKCPKCGTASLTSLPLGARTMWSCGNCNWRKTEKSPKA